MKRRRKMRQTTHKQTCRSGKDFLAEAKYRINCYNQREFRYEDPIDYSKNPHKVGLAHTTYYITDSWETDDYNKYPVSNEEFDRPYNYEVTVDLIDKKIESWLNGHLIKTVTYSEAELLVFLAGMTFDDLISEMWYLQPPVVLLAIRETAA